MSDIVLSVEVRERTGTSGAREARRRGFVPGILYGGDKDPVSISMKNNEVLKAINSGQFLASMITIDHRGEKQTVLTRDVQFHPVRDEPMHIDFQRVEEDTVITVEVGVRFINHEKSPGLKRGGVLNIVRHAVEVNTPAGQIPDEIIVDLEGYEIGESVHISAVTLPEGVAPAITDRDFTIAAVQGSRTSREVETEDSDEEVEGETKEG